MPKKTIDIGAHKKLTNHMTRLVRVEGEGTNTRYKYVWAYHCSECGWFDPEGNLIDNPLFEDENIVKKRKIDQMLPKCTCGSRTTYDAIRGCAVCLHCLKDIILPLDFEEATMISQER